MILGFPKKDPHGSPIPDKHGEIPQSYYLNLTSTKEGETVVLAGLVKSSKDLLLYLNRKNIALGTKFTVNQIESFDKSFEIILEGGPKFILSYEVCKCLLVKKP